MQYVWACFLCNIYCLLNTLTLLYIGIVELLIVNANVVNIFYLIMVILLCVLCEMISIVCTQIIG